MSFLQSQTYRNPDSSFFSGGGGGGGGVTALLGNYPGSTPTTGAVPTIFGVGSITCDTDSAGLSVIQKPVQTYLGPSAPQILTNGGGDLLFTIPISTVAGGTYVVSALVSFKSEDAPVDTALVSININNTAEGVALAIITTPFAVGSMPLAALYPQEIGITVTGVITNTTADTLSVYIHQDITVAALGPITVFVSNVLVQRVG